jgi:hypothetical protein
MLPKAGVRSLASAEAARRLKKDLPFGNPAKSKLIRSDSRRLCGPRSRVVCPCRLSFKRGALNGLREHLWPAPPSSVAPRGLSPLQADGARDTFQRNYKTARRRLSINILHRLTYFLFAI